MSSVYFTDQMGRKIEINKKPQRVISLVPSQTEFLAWMGLEDEVMGITKFCEHPEKWFRSKTRVGGTKTIHFDRVDALKPDLIIGNKEENDQTIIESLAEKYPVWMSDIKTIDDAYAMMNSLGMIFQKEEKVKKLIDNIRTNFSQIQDSIKEKPIQKVAYLIWQKPLMVAGSDTFIHSMLGIVGFQNTFETQKRYPQLTEEQFKKSSPDLILLSSEPFPFKEKHVAYFQDLCPNAQIKIVDGTYFSWYGNRLLESTDYFQKLYKDLFS